MKLWRIYFVFLFLVGVFLVYGCQAPERPDNCADSLIWATAEKIHVTPQAMGAVFQLANVEMAKLRPEFVPKIEAFLDAEEALLQKDSATYYDILTFAQTQVPGVYDRYAPELMVFMSAFSGAASQELPLSQCDRDMLLKHITDQRTVLKSVAGKAE